MALTGMEWIIIGVIVVALLLWGPSKLPEIARSIGKARTEFQKAQKEAESYVKENTTVPATDDEILVRTAKELGIVTEGKTKEQISHEIVEKSKTNQ